MSSILLKKDHNGQKAGTVISVPFLVGKELLKKGIGVYPSEQELHKATAGEHGHTEEAKAPLHGPGGKGTEAKGVHVPQVPPQPAPSGAAPKLEQKK